MPELIQRGYVSPVWLYDRFTIPKYNSDSDWNTNIPPSSFSNESIFPIKLKYLSMIQQDEEATDWDPWNPPGWGASVHAIPFRYLRVEIGKTGCSDQNLVAAPWTVLGTTSEFERQKDGAWNVSVEHILDHPYKLPRDCGLKVSVENLYPDVDYPTPRATFMAKGRDVDNYPVILAGEGPKYIYPGSKHLMDSADLYNRGKRDISIESFHYKAFDFVAAWDEGRRCPGKLEKFGRRIGFTVNPISGEPFMPMEKSIPIGVLAPLSREIDPMDSGSKLYTFPEGTYLNPRQKIGIRIANPTQADYTMDICLHGEMEVA